jgi:hypothetical protein
MAKIKRLELKRETIRNLAADDLAGIYGGGSTSGSTNLKTKLVSFGPAFNKGPDNKGPDDEDVRPPALPPGFIAPSLPSKRPGGELPSPVPQPVITGASYYCG